MLLTRETYVWLCVCGWVGLPHKVCGFALACTLTLSRQGVPVATSQVVSVIAHRCGSLLASA